MSGRRARGRGPNARGRKGPNMDARSGRGGRKPFPVGERPPLLDVVLPDLVVQFSPLTPQELQQIKEGLLNIVAAALIQQPKASVNDPIMRKMIVMVKKIAYYDPEFVLKLSMYVRLDLNIRSTANFLLSVAANILECQPYFKKYFGGTIRLPSDWIDVAATYHMLPDRTLKGKSLPTCLRKVMVAKFPDFDPYQLGKYNKERSIKKKIKKMKEEKALNPDSPKFKDQKPMLTLKQLIRQLHISKPTYNVMCLLGKKYPTTESQFRELELPGKFEEEKIGRRMKLPVPETWETLLSEKGNKASTWEELIEHKKLPFMAMLRNIRNLIYCGVHPRYHKWVQNKLSNAQTIAMSKQFPFSFFSAYEVIPKDMEHFKQLISGDEKDKKKKPTSATPAAPGAPEQIRRKKKKQILPAIMPTQKIFDDYRTALDQAVKHATVHNVQPIKGVTVVFCNVSSETKGGAPGAKGMGQSVRNIQEVGYMLGLMCKYVCEDCDFQVYSSPSSQHPDTNHLSVELIEGTILDNMKVVAEKAKELGPDGIFPFDYLEKMIRDKKRVDNFLVLSHQVINPGEGQNQLANLLTKYRSEVNSDMLFVSVDLSGSGKSAIGSDEKNPLDIMITGFSDQILRFIAERGDQNQLQYVEHIDEAKDLNKKEEKQEYIVSPWWRWLDTLGQEQEVIRYPNIVSGTPWRSIRIFISSTFLDMHGERDILTRIVFPELKERAKQRKLDIFEVDLRWGVTEEESQQGKSIELCLSEVERCRPFFVGILGNRYGWAPEDYEVPDQPRFKWVKEYPKGRSITELEMQLAALNDPQSATGSFFYFREDSFLSEVPDNLVKNFLDSDLEARDKMLDLKDRIRASGLPLYENYPCSFGGVNEGKPSTSNLTQFAERVFNDLWSAIDSQFPPEPPPNDIECERSYHQSFVQTLTSTFTGRKEALEQMNRHVEGPRTQLLIVTGKPGDGKSALLANFAREYALKDDKTFVLAHFIGASPGSTDIRKTLHRLCTEIKAVFGLSNEIPADFKELSNLFPKILEEATFKGKVIIILDAINQLDDKINRSHSLDWLPQKLPCKFIISTTEGTCLDSLHHRYQFAHSELKLGPLNPRERADLVRETLWKFHKKLDERPMNNQMRVLLKKSDAGSPLYLMVACEELRVFGVYEKISDRIKSMGDKIPKLFEEVLVRLELDHGRSLVQDVCSFILISRNGITDKELRGLVPCSDYVWSGFLRSLGPFLKPVGDQGELSFFHQQFAAAVQKRYLGNQRVLQKFHSRLAEFLYERADPHRDGTWKGGNDSRAVRELPHHLVQAEKWDDLLHVLTDLGFVELKVSLGQTYDLIEDYNFATAETGPTAANYEGKKAIIEFKTFVKANSNILLHNPVLSFQQAANQPSHTEPSKKAAIRWRDQIETRTWVEWRNRPEESDMCKQTYSGYQESITSAAFSPNGKIIAAASRDCLIRLFNAETGSELFALSGHSNWIVDLKFSKDGSNLASASWDESLKIWDVDSGRLINTYTGHARRINCCAYSNDGSYIATASWDCTIKIWNIRNAEKDAYKTINTGSRPVNTCTFSPDDKKIVAGTWDGKIKEFSVETGELLATLTGHKKSVQTLAYEPSGNHMVSGGLDNNLLLWDAQASKLISQLTQHGKAVTSVAYTVDGTHVLSTSADATTRVWQANLGRQKKLIKIIDGYMNCCAFDPSSDDRLVCGTSDCNVQIWDITEGVAKVTMEGHTRPVIACEFSYDGKFIASGSEDGMLIVWNAKTAEKVHTLTGHTASITSISWSPNDYRFASSSDDFTIRIWDATTGALSIPLLSGHSNAVKGVSFDPKGKLLASAARDNTLRIWDTRNGNALHILRGHRDWLNDVHFAPSGNKVVTCSWDFTLMLWNVRKGEASSTMRGHQSSVSSCKFSPDGKTVVSASFDGTLKIWDAESGTEITTLVGHSARVNGFCFAKDGSIASVSDDGTIKLWDPLAATEIATLVGHAGPIRNGVFSPTNKQIVTVSDDKTLKVWDVGLQKEDSDSYSYSSSSKEKGKEEPPTQRVTGHHGRVNEVNLSPDGSRLISVSDDRTFALWDVQTLTKIRQVSRNESRPFLSGQFSEDGQLIVTASDDGAIVLWDARSRDEIRVVTTHRSPATSVSFGVDKNSVVSAGWDKRITISDFRKTGSFKEIGGHEDWILSIACSTDNRYIVSGGWDTNVKIWNAAGGTEKCSLLGHSKTVTSVAFSPDARFTASASYDSCVKIWNTSNGKLERTLAGHEGYVFATAFGPKSDNILLSAGADHTVKIWDVGSGRLKNEFICQGPASAVSTSRPANINDLVMVFGDSIGNINIAKLVDH